MALSTRTLPASNTRPTPADEPVIAAAVLAERAVTDLYDTLLDNGALSNDLRQVGALFRDHHRAAADVLTALIGTAAPRGRNDFVYDSYAAAMAGTNMSAISAALRGVENTLVATHLSLLENLEGTMGANKIAAILTVEARQAAVLATLDGASLDAALVNDAVALTIDGVNS
jgi:hypothetical protein